MSDSWFAPEYSEEELARMDLLDADGLAYIYEEGERKVATRQTRAIMQPDIWTMSTGVNYARNVNFADCRGMSELLSTPPATVDQLKRNHGI